MTPTEEATFIQLWQQGASYAVIARALGIPGGTVGSRAKCLAAQGKIQPRPRGGAYPKQQALARQDQPPVQSGADMHGAQTVQSRAVQAPMHGAVQVQNSADLPIPAALAEELTRMWAAIDALRHEVHRPVHETVQSLPEPLFDDPADNTTERWNLYLKHGLRVRIEALARARGVAPSRVVQEYLWQALNRVAGNLVRTYTLSYQDLFFKDIHPPTSTVYVSLLLGSCTPRNKATPCLSYEWS